MEEVIIDEYFSFDECKQLFAMHGFHYIDCDIENQGKRRHYLFRFNNERHSFFFSVTHRKVFLGIGAKDDTTRFAMSKVIHAIIEKMNDRPCVKMIELIEGCWYQLGGAVIPKVDRYQYLINPKNYKAVKNEIKQILGSVDFTQQVEGITTMFIFHEEAVNLVRILKVLGYIEDKTEKKKKQIEISIKHKFKNRDLFKEKLRDIGFSV